MLQLLPQTQILTPNTNSAADTVRFINEHIEKHHCENMDVDISYMNILDACYVTTMCSTTHYIKYPNGKINWKVSSDLVQEFNKSLELGNSSYL